MISNPINYQEYLVMKMRHFVLSAALVALVIAGCQKATEVEEPAIAALDPSPTELPKPAEFPPSEGVGELGATPMPDTDVAATAPTKEELYCQESARELQAAGEKVLCVGTSIVTAPNEAQIIKTSADASPANDDSMKPYFLELFVEDKWPCAKQNYTDKCVPKSVEEYEMEFEQMMESNINWSTDEILDLSRNGIPDTGNEGLRVPFCGMFRDQLEETGHMNACLAGAYGE